MATDSVESNNSSSSLIGKKSSDNSSSLPSKSVFPVYQNKTNNKEKTLEDVNKKKEYLFYKYSKDVRLAEAILIKNHPVFLQIVNRKPVLSEIIDMDNHILIPPDKTLYLSKEYVFSSIEEIEQYIKRAAKENLDSLYQKTKNIWKKYFDIYNEALSLCAADTIFTYFQDKLGMTHYLLFVGDNSTGKSNALRIFNHLGYRPLFDVSITTANIYNFLGQFEEGQGIILEDEIDNIENQEDKMRIYKTGYVSGAQVTRMYDSPNGNNKGKGQQKYNTFCFKAFSSERQPSYKAKGFSERIFTIKCSPGSPLNDISEVVNDAGDSKHKKLFREIDDLRKLLLVYRIIHYDDQIPDIHLSIKNRDKQLCKPVIRLFNNTKALEEIVASLTKFLYERYDKKLNSLDSYLFSVISDLVKDENTIISNEDLWKIVCCLPGSFNQYKPQSYQTDEFGNISKTVVTKICEDKFGAHKEHDGEKRSLVFNKTILQKLKDNYSTVKKIEILDNNSAANTPNTFNTFWSHVERNGDYKSKVNSDKMTKNGPILKTNSEYSYSNNEINDGPATSSFEDEDVDSPKVLEVLKVLENEKQIADTKNTTNKSSSLLNYRYTKEDIENYFASDNGQIGDHGLEDSICKPLIGQQKYKPFFHYCKICPKIEFLNLKSIEDHVRLKDPQRHKAKLFGQSKEENT